MGFDISDAMLDVALEREVRLIPTFGESWAGRCAALGRNGVTDREIRSRGGG